MLRLAFRNLFQNKIRFAISVGGVALALMLILALDAIVAGTERQVTAYIDYSGADVWVSQENVRNMHMAYSAMPASVASRVKTVRGVESVTSVLYLTNLIEIGSERNAAYVIGLPNDPIVGMAWHIAEGKRIPGKEETIIDRGIAAKSKVGIGDKVKILGEEFTIAGLSEGTASVSGGSVAFITKNDWQRLESSSGSVSFVLVKVAAGELPQAVADRIQAQVDKVTAQTREQFASQERKVIDDMSTDIITIMNLVGFLIGVAVMALTVYTATLARRAEYGVLKAIGAHNAHLYRAVLGQAFISVALGFTLGIGFILLLSAIISSLGLQLALEVRCDALVKVSSVSLVIAALSAILPIKQIAGLDPVMVFRGR